jgi:hypothetical protein
MALVIPSEEGNLTVFVNNSGTEDVSIPIDHLGTACGLDHPVGDEIGH